MDKQLMELGVAGLLAYQVFGIVREMVKGAFEMKKRRQEPEDGNGATIIPCYQLMQKLVEAEVRQTAILEEQNRTMTRVEEKVDRAWNN